MRVLARIRPVRNPKSDSALWRLGWLGTNAASDSLKVERECSDRQKINGATAKRGAVSANRSLAPKLNLGTKRVLDSGQRLSYG
jgi:hypothetical protein